MIEIIAKEQVDQYVEFFKNYYPVKDLRLCVIVATDREFSILDRWIKRCPELPEKSFPAKKLNAKLEHTESVPVKNTAAGIVQSVVFLLAQDRASQDEIEKVFKTFDAYDNFMSCLYESRYLILLRRKFSKDPTLFYEMLFHEILHAIELELEKRIFTGSADDEERIVRPYVERYQNST